MSLVRRNVIANLIGNGWVALISIAFIPLYIHFIGVEAYGLVGFYMTLQAVFAVLDMGLTATMSRELAKLSSSDENAQQMRNLVRTLEWVYWGIALMIMFAVVLLAPWIATQWLNANTISQPVLTDSVMLMGMIIATRMLYGFYSGGLLGLQKQVLLNVIKITIETLKSGGVVLVLWWVSSEITTFFLWQLAISVIGVCIMLVTLWKCIPATKQRTFFQLSIFQSIWRFAAGMSAITVLSAVLVQMDKVVLSKMLTLQSFAYYSLASTVAVGLYVIIGSVYTSAYPRFIQLLASREELALKRFYHKSCQMMTVLVMPLAMVISFFSLQILQVWTRDGTVAGQSAPILSILVIGTALNGMMSLPFALQLSHGWTRLAAAMNLVAIIILLPALVLAVRSYGASGAAVIWLLLNAGYLVFGLFLMHRKVLRGELRQWVVSGFVLPSLASFSVMICFWLAFPEDLGSAGQLLWIASAGVIACLAAALAAPAIRDDILLRSGIIKLAD